VSRNEIAQGQFARQLIASRARRLARKSGFEDMTFEDLSQELMLRLLRGLSSFDQNRSPKEPFTALVIRRAVGMLRRERLAEKRGAGKVRYQGCFNDLADAHSAQEFHRLELKHDIGSLLTVCPAKIRPLVEQLQEGTLADAARNLNMPRSTLQRWLQQLRMRFDHTYERIDAL
jgi:DNA-directed RNA polymerase specialized sigma24 family protein